MLVDVEGDIKFLVPQAVLNILEWCVVFEQFGGVSVPQTVIIELFDVQLIVNNA